MSLSDEDVDFLAEAMQRQGDRLRTLYNYMDAQPERDLYVMHEIGNVSLWMRQKAELMRKVNARHQV